MCGGSSGCFPGPPIRPRPYTGSLKPRATGKASVEEVRLSPPLNSEGEARWYKIKVGPLALGTERACLWSVADVTREREGQENVFQELRHAIDFLDHAPAGFFSCRHNGEVSYMNATLAGWLGYDPAEASSGRLKLADFVAAAAAH